MTEVEDQVQAPLRVVTNPNTGKTLPIYQETLKRKRDGVPEEKVYLCTRANGLQDVVEFWGEEVILDVFMLDLTRRSRKWTTDATDDKSGTVDAADFDRMFIDYSARSESIAEIKERIQHLATEVLPAIFMRLDLDGAAKGAEAQKVSERIRKLNQDIKNKRRKTPEDEQELEKEATA